MENRISVLPDINMEVGGGNLGSWWRFWEATSKKRPMKVYRLDGEHLAHENWPDSEAAGEACQIEA
ncbi:hypothetical protein Goari_005155, partial [Gossypium aridum]|nr:hypothetical protein [Gossypium aridum]